MPPTHDQFVVVTVDGDVPYSATRYNWNVEHGALHIKLKSTADLRADEDTWRVWAPGQWLGVHEG